MKEHTITNRVRIASPCNADWEAMEGDERVRFCQSCNKQVYNFSALTHAEIADLIHAREGKLCARFYQRRDGTMLTANCPVGRRRQRKRDCLGLCLGALAVFASYLGIAATSDKAADDPTATLSVLQRMEYQWRAWFRPNHGRALMGDVCITPPTAPPQNRTSAK